MSASPEGPAASGAALLEAGASTESAGAGAGASTEASGAALLEAGASTEASGAALPSAAGAACKYLENPLYRNFLVNPIFSTGF